MSVDQITAQDTTTEADPTEPGATTPSPVGEIDAEGTDTGAGKQVEDKPRRGRPRKQSAARKIRTVELNLTITGTLDGDWQAELTHSGERVVSGMSIPAASVARAAKELNSEISAHIDNVINAAREQQLARVTELEAQLEQAKKALAELES
jgi:hypothetical protein